MLTLLSRRQIRYYLVETAGFSGPFLKLKATAFRGPAARSYKRRLKDNPRACL
jgi:hypothetical protein